MKKCQSALEYMLVYGWVFIIIVIVGSGLLMLGVFNPKIDLSARTEHSFGLEKVGVFDHKLVENGTWALSLFSRGYEVLITHVIIGGESFDFNQSLKPDELRTLRGELLNYSELASSYEYNMQIIYVKTVSGLTHLASGVFTGVVEKGLTLTQQVENNFYQTTKLDFASGSALNTDYNTIPGAVILDSLNNWFNNHYLNRIIYNVTERSGHELINQPVNIVLNTNSLIRNNKMQPDCSDLRIIVDDLEVPIQVETGTINTQETVIWFLVNLSAYETKTVHAYYNNPYASKPFYLTDLSYKTGVDGYFQNNKLYAGIGNNNNPSSWGFDSIYDKIVARDIVNYHTFFFNRDANNYHSVSAVDAGPVYVELLMTGSGNELNNGDLKYRLYAHNNFIQWMHDSIVEPGEAFFIGTDNTELYAFDSGGVVNDLENYTAENIENSYNRLFNPVTNYSIVMTAPVYLNNAVVKSGTHEFIGLYNASSVFMPYFNYYVGVFTASDCNKLGKVSNNQPVSIILAEEGIYESSGNFTSKEYKAGANPVYEFLNFSSFIDTYTDIRIQLRTSSSLTGLNTAEWRGPSGTNNYYVVNSSINQVHNGDDWIQYRVFFSTTNPVKTPVLYDVLISFSQ